MLTLHVQVGDELFDEAKQEFVKPTIVLQLEHSLVSLSKWEQFFEKPFLGKDKKTTEETIWYIKAMTLNQVSPEIYNNISDENINEITDYIEAKMTATWFNELRKEPPPRETITAELIYFWMIQNGVPFECQYWHLNRLMTLLRVCNVKNSPKKKVGRKEAAQVQRQLNAERKARFNTKG